MDNSEKQETNRPNLTIKAGDIAAREEGPVHPKIPDIKLESPEPVILGHISPENEQPDYELQKTRELQRVLAQRDRIGPIWRATFRTRPHVRERTNREKYLPGVALSSPP
jgi:hypothetical protein